MKILGIMWEENSTAALYIDGEIIACASEERFSRQKNDERYPKNAIEYVLKQGGIEANEIDFVAFTGKIWNPLYVLTRRYSTFSIADRLREQHEYWRPLFYEKKKVNYLDVFKDKLDIKQYPSNWKKVISFLKSTDDHPKNRVRRQDFFQSFRQQVVSSHLKISKEKIIFVDHHECHAAYAYYASPRKNGEKILIMTADAWGDDLNATISVAQNNDIKRIASTANFMGAHLYRYITQLLGMKADQDEYKVMGMAPYGKFKYFEPIYRIFLMAQEVKGLDFIYKKKPSDLYFYYRDKLEGIRFDNIAAGLQYYVQKLLVDWTKNTIAKTGIKKIRFAGGAAMNVKAMMEIAKIPGVEVFVPSAPSDESTAAGAIYALAKEQIKKIKGNPEKIIKAWKNSYLGPDIRKEEITSLLKKIRNNKKYKIYFNLPLKLIALELAKGKIIGRCVGRSEFGPRALGNRSILADPRNREVIKKINNSVKSRDFWMPFAATILESRANDYLIGYKKSIGAPYMTVAFETKPLAHEHLKAGLHPEDLTCRPQVLKPGQNRDYEALIKEFEKITGVGGVLNTSFNFHGEPIVQTCEDAFRIFSQSNLDGVILENVFILKK